jgi:hypothetical protein
MMFSVTPKAFRLMKEMNIDIGDRETHEERVAQAEEEEQRADHQDHPEDDVVEELVHLHAGVIALVVGLGDR